MEIALFKLVRCCTPDLTTRPKVPVSFVNLGSEKLCGHLLLLLTSCHILSTTVLFNVQYIAATIKLFKCSLMFLPRLSWQTPIVGRTSHGDKLELELYFFLFLVGDRGCLCHVQPYLYLFAYIFFPPPLCLSLSLFHKWMTDKWEFEGKNIVLFVFVHLRLCLWVSQEVSWAC